MSRTGNSDFVAWILGWRVSTNGVGFGSRIRTGFLNAKACIVGDFCKKGETLSSIIFFVIFKLHFLMDFGANLFLNLTNRSVVNFWVLRKWNGSLSNWVWPWLPKVFLQLHYGHKNISRCHLSFVVIWTRGTLKSTPETKGFCFLLGGLPTDFFLPLFGWYRSRRSRLIYGSSSQISVCRVVLQYRQR